MKPARPRFMTSTRATGTFVEVRGAAQVQHEDRFLIGDRLSAGATGEPGGVS